MENLDADADLLLTEMGIAESLALKEAGAQTADTAAPLNTSREALPQLRRLAAALLVLHVSPWFAAACAADGEHDELDAGLADVAKAAYKTGDFRAASRLWHAAARNDVTCVCLLYTSPSPRD